MLEKDWSGSHLGSSSTSTGWRNDANVIFVVVIFIFFYEKNKDALTEAREVI